MKNFHHFVHAISENFARWFFLYCYYIFFSFSHHRKTIVYTTIQKNLWKILFWKNRKWKKKHHKKKLKNWRKSIFYIKKKQNSCYFRETNFYRIFKERRMNKKKYVKIVGKWITQNIMKILRKLLWKVFC